MSGPVSELLAGAFHYWETRQATVSNNLANVATDGFRGERVFARLVEGSDAPVAESGTDFRRGPLTRTDNPLDVALEGPGFLVVETPRGPRYTRGGALGVSAAGVLVDGSGHPVLTDTGSVQLPPGEISVDPSGEIRVDGDRVARLRVERFPDGIEPPREGDTHFLAPDGVAPEEAPDTRVRQGHVEASNVDPVGALVEMMEVQRAYTALERSARTLDGVMETIANRLGRIE